MLSSSINSLHKESHSYYFMPQVAQLSDLFILRNVVVPGPPPHLYLCFYFSRAAAIIDEDLLRYERIKKKGYVRVVTNKGQLNLELHADMVTMATPHYAYIVTMATLNSWHTCRPNRKYRNSKQLKRLKIVRQNRTLAKIFALLLSFCIYKKRVHKIWYVF